MKRHHVAMLIAISIILLLSVGVFTLQSPAKALDTQLLVNTTDDTDDGTCDETHCSLREALAAARSPGSDTITFNIPTSDPGYDPANGVWTIQPTTGYNVPSDTTVDGSIATLLADGTATSRPGIEIDGTNLAPLGITGLRVGNNVTLRGLVVNHFQYGIWVSTASVIIEGCYVGTDPTGTSAKPNGIDGILVANGATGAVIQDNVLSGNNGSGIRMFGDATAGNTVRNNRIGTTTDGTAPLPNGGDGVRLHAEAHDNAIGPGNLIAFNNSDGVEVDGAGTRGNTISQNRIHSNGGMGIRLTGGGNDELAPPVISSASATQVSGTACPNCVIEVFSDAEDEGAVYEGATTADVAGNWTLTRSGGLIGPNVTATATNGAGNTSEFSAPIGMVQRKVYLPLVRKSGESGESGRTYYVATNGSDEAGDGSAANPWRTIQFAVDQAGPGDAILVRSGAYAGFRIEQSGAPEAWITLKAAPGAEVLINRPGPNNKHNSNIEVETWAGDGVVAYWVIEGFEVADAPNWGIDLRGNDQNHSHHITVRGNRVHHNGIASGTSGIFTAFVDNVLIENNESYANGEHGVYHSNSADNPVIRGNVLHHNPNCGIHMNGDLSQGGDGIISNGLVEDNVIYENGTGGCSAINLDGVANTLVRNNLLYQNHAGGISLYQGDGAVCSQDNRILNNTLVMADDGRWAINVSHATCVNNKLFNNVIYSYHSWRGSIVIPTAGLAGFESDYNVVMDRFSADDDNSVITLAQWQALGYDLNSRIATPNDLFVSPAGNDYHLKAGSPAIDAGILLPDVTDDLEGNPRPWGAAFDIGAFEYAAGTPTATPTPPSGGGGHITYSLPNGRVYRILAQPGATPEDVSLALDDLAPGSEDEGLNTSPDGAWLVLDTDRFDPECAGWPCLAIVTGDLSAGEAVRANGELIHPEGFSAVASGGDLIVYPAGGGPHTRDLWAVARSGDAWGPPVLLTGASPYDWHEYPAIAADGSKVVFNCGSTYGGAGTALCEVGTNGTGFRVVLNSTRAVPGEIPLVSFWLRIT